MVHHKTRKLDEEPRTIRLAVDLTAIGFQMVISVSVAKNLAIESRTVLQMEIQNMTPIKRKESLSVIFTKESLV